MGRPREIGDIDHAGVSATCQYHEALVGIEDQRCVLGQVVLFHAGWRLHLVVAAPIPFGIFSRHRTSQPNTGVELHGLVVNDKLSAAFLIRRLDGQHRVDLHAVGRASARQKNSLADMSPRERAWCRGQYRIAERGESSNVVSVPVTEDDSGTVVRSILSVPQFLRTTSLCPPVSKRMRCPSASTSAENPHSPSSAPSASIVDSMVIFSACTRPLSVAEGSAPKTPPHKIKSRARQRKFPRSCGRKAQFCRK
jgi:hypothetical protein